MKSLTKSKNFIRKNTTNFYVVFFSIFLILLIICLVINPSKYIKSCYNGLITWAICVLPALLPFFVITKLLTELKSLDKFFNKFSLVNKKLFNAPSCSGYIFGMSIISGYPVGAKLINDFYKNNIISSKQANKLTSFCSTSGPLFIIGSVGSMMLGSIKIGYILYFSHVLSAILNGILYRNCYKDDYENKQLLNKKTDFNSLLSSTMTSSISSVLVVGGFIAIFFMIIDILGDLNIFYPLISLLDNIFPKGVSSGIVNGIIEVTRGCKDLSGLNLSPTLVATICSALIGFGGFSIHAQSLCFLTECKVNIKFYFLQKITQTIFACVICFLLCLILL